MTAPAKRPSAALAVPLPDELAEAAAKAQRIREGIRAEVHHLLYDADPDSTVPPFVDLHKHGGVPDE